MTFDIRGTPAVKKALAALGQSAPRAVGAALFREGERIIGQSKREVPVDMDVLRSSGHVELPEYDASRVTVRCGFGGAASPYAIYVHEGTGPAVGRPAFFPPTSALEGWVRRNIRPPEDQLKQVTFLVARAIGRRGLPPTKFLERPFVAAQAGMAGRIARSLRSWLEHGRAV